MRRRGRPNAFWPSDTATGASIDSSLSHCYTRSDLEQEEATMPKKILAVDDERHIVRLVEVNLARAGYNVVTAFDGREALQKVEAEKPDLVVLDVMMPFMDGFEVLRNLKANPETADIPVIMLTAKAQD